MSKNCLVTKLKAIVNNDALEHFGELTVEFKELSEPTPLNMRCLGATKVYAVDGSNMVSSGANTTNWNSEAAPSSADYAVSVLAENGKKVRIVGFYDIIHFGFTGSISTIYASFDEEKLKYFTKLESIYSNQQIELDSVLPVEVLSKMTTLKSFRFQTKQLVGDIKELGYLPSISSIYVSGTNIKGKIEDFVHAQRSIGRTSSPEGGIYMPWVQVNLTIGGNAISTQQTGDNAKLYWTASTITYDSGRQGVEPIVVNA